MTDALGAIAQLLLFLIIPLVAFDIMKHHCLNVLVKRREAQFIASLKETPK